ncbi:hypothetical protein DFH28DRAFT_1139682 [Melampsora americana]|nr:hypothetical protein DFH28DRAFT_1139682 [Melampsora americana]
MDTIETSFEAKFEELASQVQRVSLGLAQQGELLSNISNTPPKKKGRASVGSQKGTPKKKEPHPLELVEIDEINYLKLAGHTHLRVIMGRSDACTPLPPPPSNSEKQKITIAVPSVSAYPSDSVPPLTPMNQKLADHGVISQGFADYIRTSLSRVGLTRFTYDWEGRFEDQFNQFALQFFLNTFKQGILAFEYGIGIRQPIDDIDLKLTAFFYIHIQTLKAQYKAQLKNPNVLNTRKDASRVRKAKVDRCTDYAEYLSEIGANKNLIDIFVDYHVVGEEVDEKDNSKSGSDRQVIIPSWWSEKRTLRKFVAATHSTIETSNVPKGLPEDCYTKHGFLDCLLPVQLKMWNLQPPILPADISMLFSPSYNNNPLPNPSNASISTSNTQVPSNGSISTSNTQVPSNGSISTSNTQVVCPSFSNPSNKCQDESEFPQGMFEDLGNQAMANVEDEEDEVL